MFQFESREIEYDVMNFVNGVLSDLDSDVVNEVYIDECSLQNKIHIVFVLDGNVNYIPPAFLDCICRISYEELPSKIKIDASVEQDGMDRGYGYVIYKK